MKVLTCLHILTLAILGLFLSSETALCAISIYTDKAAFLAETGVPQYSLDFESYGDGVLVQGQPTITGSEWLEQGVSFSSDVPGKNMILAQDNEDWTPSSGSHAIIVGGGSTDVSNFSIHFTNPVSSVGLVLCDSELNNGYAERLNLYSSDDVMLVSIPLPVYGQYTSGPEANYFIGFVSDTPVARISMIECPSDGEEVLIDDLMYSVPEPAALSLLVLGGLPLLRRRKK